jgi:hypothetical protein
MHLKLYFALMKKMQLSGHIAIFTGSGDHKINKTDLLV